jgi:hypothetical protein
MVHSLRQLSAVSGDVPIEFSVGFAAYTFYSSSQLLVTPRIKSEKRREVSTKCDENQFVQGNNFKRRVEHN